MSPKSSSFEWFNFGRVKMKQLIAISACLVSASAVAQFTVNGWSGRFEVNGNPYAGGPINPGNFAQLVSDDLTPFSSVSFGMYANNGFDTGRTMMKFTANGAGTFNLPSDRDGGTASANSGDTVFANTWNPLWFGVNPEHIINADVAADPGESASIDIDIQAAPETQYFRESGSFVHDYLDGSIYDIDPTPGSIVIDKTLTPTINLSYVLPAYRFFRGEVTWADTSSSPSAFMDLVTSGMWFNLATDSQLYIFGSAFSSGEQIFNAGEGATSKVVGEFGSAFAFDISNVPLGLYTGQYWAIPWTNFGTDTELGGLSIGGVEQEDLEQNIRIVPEPGTALTLLPLMAFVAVRKRRRS